MKKVQIIVSLLALVLASSCIKNEEDIFDNQTVVEWDAAAYNANAAGLTYPILTRVPGYGRAATSSDPALSRTLPGIKKFRVNLVGGQRPTPTRVYYTVFQGTTAIEDVHYKKLSGQVTIPANSSFGEMEIDILNPGASTPATRDLNLLLTGGEEGVTSSVNYRILALRIAQ